MIKNIPLTGLSATPDDYSCPDGQLEIALNASFDKGTLAPVIDPPVLFNIPPECRLQTIHKVQGNTNYIFSAKRGNNTILYYHATTPGTTPSGTLVFTDTNKFATIGELRKVTSVGNLLIISTDSDIYYAIWRDNTYQYLGARPSFVPIQFGLQKAGTFTSADIYIPKSTLSPDTSGSQATGSGSSSTHPLVSTVSDETDIRQATDAVLGAYLNQAAAYTSQGYFIMPFFIRYAFRLFDGTHIWHSAPILMLPTVLLPCLQLGSRTLDSSSDMAKLNLLLDENAYFRLRYRILQDIDPEWKDVIAGIDIYASAPIYTWDQSKSFARYTSSYLTLVSQAPTGGRGRHNSSLVNPTETFFRGHYAEIASDNYRDVSYTYSQASAISQVWSVCPNTNFQTQITGCSLFYKLASIPFGDIKESATFSELPVDSSDLSNLVNRERLEDDFRSHYQFTASDTYTFNSRLNLATSTVAPPKPLPVRSLIAASNVDDEKYSNIYVVSKLEGHSCYSAHTDMLGSTEGSDIPRFLFVPDPNASRIVFVRNGRIIADLELTPHDTLNGAYWYGGTGATPSLKAPEDDQVLHDRMISEITSLPTRVPLTNKIYLSEAGNPFLFPAASVCTVGSGSISRITSATKALSQGQFGQFPLYAFTDEGVWALDVSTKGTYSTVHPLSRDVCTNPASVTQTDSSIIFTSNRGIMLLSGSKVQCISDTIQDDAPTDISSLPGIGRLYRTCGIGSPDCLTPIPLRQYLADASMLYDYTNQRLLVFSPTKPYCYIYSLADNSWSTSTLNLSHPLNAYPSSWASTPAGSVLDISATSPAAEALSSFIVTRPIKFGDGSILKTVSEMAARGRFLTGRVSTVLYGSRDLVNWSLISSSRTHRISGYMGTPYRFFRVVIVLNLDRGESVAALTFDVTPRMTNRIR